MQSRSLQNNDFKIDTIKNEDMESSASVKKLSLNPKTSKIYLDQYFYIGSNVRLRNQAHKENKEYVDSQLRESNIIKTRQAKTNHTHRDKR